MRCASWRSTRIFNSVCANSPSSSRTSWKKRSDWSLHFAPHLRSVPKDTRLGDVDIPAGATVLLLWGAANRDPAVFERPDEVVLGRPRRHVAFGRDIHYCVGAPLARLEARASCSRCFSESTSSITLDPDRPPRWVNSLMVRRYAPLPVRFVPR